MQKQTIRIISGWIMACCLAACVGCGSEKEEFEAFVIESEKGSEQESEEEKPEVHDEKVKPQGSEAKEGNEASAKSGGEEMPADLAAEEQLLVHVCGAVKKPGVYEFPAGSRICDAVQAAGGMTESAAADYLNQAAKITDGQQLYVPTKEEARANPVQAGTQGSISGQTEPSESSKVNLNQASKEELMTLTGIGEAKAESIIRYREEQGGFRSIDELMNIEGIKEGVFQKIKDDITVT